MKKFTLLVICLLIGISCCLSGCSTFSVNYVKYYNETVAVVDNEKISRFDLVNAYNNYGYTYYVNQLGKTKKEALNESLDLLIERKLLSNYAEETYKLTQYEINEVYKAVLDNLSETFDSYKVEARKSLGLNAIEETEDEESETAYKREDYKYTKRAQLLSGNIIDYIEPEEKQISSYALGENDADKEFVTKFDTKSTNDIILKIYSKFISNASNNQHDEARYSEIYDKSMANLAKYLISYERYLRDDNGNKYSTDTPSLIKRLIERVYESELESAYIEKLQNEYLKTANDLSIDKLLNKFESLLEADWAKYDNSLTDYYDYLKTIGSNAEMVYYTPTNANATFGYFLHVLIPLDETVIDEIDAEKELGIYSETGLKEKIESLIADETHQARGADGLLEEAEIRVADILKEYGETVYDLNSFMDFMFKYTSDNATLTADMPYVIGYEGDTEYSSMVEEFTDEAIRLMKTNTTDSSLDDFTSKDNYVITQYGIHLLYHLGDVKADFDYIDKANVAISYDKNVENNLYYTYTNELTEKTYFDLLFDLVYPADDSGVYASDNGYTDYEETKLESLKKGNVLTYSTKIKGTLSLIK